MNRIMKPRDYLVSGDGANKRKPVQLTALLYKGGELFSGLELAVKSQGINRPAAKTVPFMRLSIHKMSLAHNGSSGGIRP